jgi:hypothetical protein
LSLELCRHKGVVAMLKGGVLGRRHVPDPRGRCMMLCSILLPASTCFTCVGVEASAFAVLCSIMHMQSTLCADLYILEWCPRSRCGRPAMPGHLKGN